MEHPLRLDELQPGDPPRSIQDAPQTTAPVAPATLPPLPNLSSSDVTFLRPGDAHYSEYLPAANARKQVSPALPAWSPGPAAPISTVPSAAAATRMKASRNRPMS